jgi:RNA polymerase sigma-70 factor (ECF subfamily)
MTFADELDRRSLEQVLAGRPSALLDLYDRYAADVFRHVYPVLGNRTDAEDVVQETFTTAWFDATSWKERPRATIEWLLEIARGRLALRGAPGATPALEPPSAALPRSLRDRVLDSVYGAGERLRPPFHAPQWARVFPARWVVWALALGEIGLILAFA